MKFKIYHSDIITFLFFHISFITLPYFEYYDLMKYGIVAIIALYLFRKCGTLLKVKYKVINIVLAMFLIVVLITSYINKNNIKERNIFLAAIVFVAIILEAFLLFQYFGYKNKINRVLNITYYLTTFYVIMTDLLLLVYPELVIETEGYYLIGNKFSVVYTHLLMMCLHWYMRENKIKSSKNSRIRAFLMFVLTMFISLYIGSATGVVASVLLVSFMLFHEKSSSIVMKPLVPVIVLGVACSFLLFSSPILNNSFIKFLVEDILQRDITLTGRTDIYASVFSLIPGHLWSGYGHGSTFEVCMELLGAPNTQNGLLELLVQYGIIGVVLFLVLMFLVFRKNSYLKNRPHSIPIVAMLYIYIILASVEITLGLDFFVLLAIMVVCSEMDRRQVLNEKQEGESCDEDINSLNA